MFYFTTHSTHFIYGYMASDPRSPTHLGQYCMVLVIKRYQMSLHTYWRDRRSSNADSKWIAFWTAVLIICQRQKRIGSKIIYHFLNRMFNSLTSGRAFVLRKPVFSLFERCPTFLLDHK